MAQDRRPRQLKQRGASPILSFSARQRAVSESDLLPPPRSSDPISTIRGPAVVGWRFVPHPQLSGAEAGPAFKFRRVRRVTVHTSSHSLRMSAAAASSAEVPS